MQDAHGDLNDALEKTHLPHQSGSSKGHENGNLGEGVDGGVGREEAADAGVNEEARHCNRTNRKLPRGSKGDVKDLREDACVEAVDGMDSCHDRQSKPLRNHHGGRCECCDEVGLEILAAVLRKPRRHGHEAMESISEALEGQSCTLKRPRRV